MGFRCGVLQPSRHGHGYAIMGVKEAHKVFTNYEQPEKHVWSSAYDVPRWPLFQELGFSCAGWR